MAITNAWYQHFIKGIWEEKKMKKHKINYNKLFNRIYNRLPLEYDGYGYIRAYEETERIKEVVGDKFIEDLVNKGWLSGYFDPSYVVRLYGEALTPDILDTYILTETWVKE